MVKISIRMVVSRNLGIVIIDKVKIFIVLLMWLLLYIVDIMFSIIVNGMVSMVVNLVSSKDLFRCLLISVLIGWLFVSEMFVLLVSKFFNYLV